MSPSLARVAGPPGQRAPARPPGSPRKGLAGARALALALAFAPACLVEYAIGGASATDAETCPEGQEPCGDGCAPAGACDDCPQGQVPCDGTCVAAGACGDEGCPEGQIQCGEACADPDSCPCEQGCGEELEVCDDGVCRCRDGLERCGPACVDTRADGAHCGDCDQSCGDEASLCQAGDCVTACNPPRVVCDGACVELAADPLHCGDCDRPCRSDELCVAGDCVEYLAIEACTSCPCPDACAQADTGETGDSAGSRDTGDNGLACCDSVFLGAPVCVEGGCE